MQLNLTLVNTPPEPSVKSGCTYIKFGNMLWRERIGEVPSRDTEKRKRPTFTTANHKV